MDILFLKSLIYSHNFLPLNKLNCVCIEIITRNHKQMTSFQLTVQRTYIFIPIPKSQDIFLYLIPFFFEVILGILGTQYTPFDPPRLFVVGAEKCLHFPCNYCPRRQCNFPSYQMPKRKEQASEFRVFTKRQISSNLFTYNFLSSTKV